VIVCARNAADRISGTLRSGGERPVVIGEVV
jgi:hypothetical protein